jgi:hypothetical protein
MISSPVNMAQTRAQQMAYMPIVLVDSLVLLIPT